MRVAFVTPGAFPVPSAMGGSVERVVEKVVPKLSPFADVVVYSRTGRRLALSGRMDGVPILRFPAANKDVYFANVCRSLRRFQPNIIQVENRPRWVPLLRRRFPSAEIWLSLHSTTFITGKRLGRLHREKCLQAADRILVNSEYLQQYIASRWPRTEHKIRVNHLGVEAYRFPGRSTLEGMMFREQGRRKRGWTGRKIVLFVGRLVPQKGVHHLLSAVPAIVAQHPDALIVVVGSALYGSHRRTRYVNALHRQAKTWRRHVHFQPYIPHDEIPYWFSMADLVVVPSIGNEAFGLVNVEAMAAELPVIATRAGGMKEVVADGETGYLVTKESPLIVREIASRVSELLSDDALRMAMGMRGKERVMRKFLWEHTAQRWLALALE